MADQDSKMDLDTIEHLWDVLCRQVWDEYEEPAATLDQLAQRLINQWNRLPKAEFSQVDNKHAKCMQTCPQRSGGHSGY